MVWEDEQPPDCQYIIQSWDTAFTKTERSDYSACTTWGVFYNNSDADRRGVHVLLVPSGSPGQLKAVLQFSNSNPVLATGASSDPVLAGKIRFAIMTPARVPWRQTHDRLGHQPAARQARIRPQTLALCGAIGKEPRFLSLGRALARHARGQRFDPVYLHHQASAVAPDCRGSPQVPMHLPTVLLAWCFSCGWTRSSFPMRPPTQRSTRA